MHALDEPSTINAWIRQPGDIHLRRVYREPVPQEGRGIAVLFWIALAALPWLVTWLRLQ